MSRPISTTGYARWCFKTDNGRFKSMGKSVNSCIEGVFAQSPRPSSFTVKSAGQTYFIDFDSMKQRNMKTKYVREIQRQYIDAASGAVAAATQNNAPLLLLPASSSILAAANSSSNNNASSTTTGSSSLKRTRRVNPNKPLSKTAARLQRIEKAKDEMRADTKECYDKILDSVKTLSPDDKNRVLARVIFKLFHSSYYTPFTISLITYPIPATAMEETKELKSKLAAKRNWQTSKACRHQLALNLGRVMIGSSGGPQW